MERELTCIICPVGCAIGVRYDPERERIISLDGYRCPRGEAYAREEVLAPVRTLTSTMRIRNGALPLVPVRSDRPVPRESLIAIMERLAERTVTATVECGEVLIENVCGTGANIVATRTLERVDESGYEGTNNEERSTVR